MVKFDRQIAPGKEGIISLALQTLPEWGGRRLTKRAIVVTNDPKKKKFTLTVSVSVEGPPDLPKELTDPKKGSAPPAKDSATKPGENLKSARNSQTEDKVDSRPPSDPTLISGQK